MGKIVWQGGVPFEQLPWGGLRRVPPNDPRFVSNPKSITVDAKGDPKVEPKTDNEDSDDVDMTPDRGNKRSADEAGLSSQSGAVDMTPDRGNKRSADEAGLSSQSGADRTRPPPMQDGSRNTELALRTATPGSASGSNGTGETPVDLHLPRELGTFTETRTAILPIRFGFFFNALNNNFNALNFANIRFNAPYNILQNVTFVGHAEGVAATVGPGTHQAQAYTSTNPATFTNFETTLVPGTAQTPSNSGAGVVADSTGAGVVADSAGVDPDPQWVENLVILALTDEYTPNQFGNLNVFLELRYVVQFKDLKQTFRYPTLGDTPVTFSCPDDVVQRPATPYNWGSTS
ncbi:hypothetical protein PINS_up016202 [Pythium insidiosum]|nr:hypothetical protein PINS_up016202 [Pythium insidiosum]